MRDPTQHRSAETTPVSPANRTEEASGARLPHLSYSRLSRYEQCPLSYRLHYIEQLTAEPGTPLRFGSAVHSVLEDLVIEQLESERAGALPEARACALWQKSWTTSGLSGLSLFTEGLLLLRRFVGDQGVLDPHDVLAVEKEFRLRIGGFEVLGYLDRVDRVDDETVEVIDYKTNRQLFTREEIDSSLQLSLYQLAAQALWPWAKKVRLSFWMLRHGLRQTTERSAEQLDGTRHYVEALGAAIRDARMFPARLNPSCIYCDHKHHCETYEQALQGKRTLVCEDLRDLEAVAAEREEVARLAKVLYARKHALESVLRTALKEKDELVLSGVRYAMFKTSKYDYPLGRTLKVLGDATGLDREALIERIAAVDNKALDDLLKDMGRAFGRPRVKLLKAELDTLATQTHTPRFWATEVK